MPTIKFITLGCKVNQYDTQSIRESFQAAGFREINNGRKTDYCLINTCTVTAKADKESLSFIRKARVNNPKAKIVVTGCLSELDADKIRRADKNAIIIKNKDKPKIISLLNIKHTPYFLPLIPSKGISEFRNHTRAFLKIQDGCDNFCSYCKVPLVRGMPKSKNLNDIIKEAEGLVLAGHKEIVLTGICLGAYGKDLKTGQNLFSVVRGLEQIDGLARIRLSSIELNDINDEIIEFMSSSGKLCRHLHIPLQSADDEILKKMNRRYSRREFLQRVKKIKTAVPQIAITTDCLIGFPGEEKRHFENTLRAIKEIMPLKVHIFTYSPRKGTAAAKLSGQVHPAVMKERLLLLKDAALQSRLHFFRGFLGKILPVLIEERLKNNPLAWQGNSDNYIPVSVKSEKPLKNQIITVKIKKIGCDYLFGKLGTVSG